MNANAYINIPYFLRGKFDLKGSELIISALIYGFSQDGETWFTGNTAYICQWTGTEKKNVLRCLGSLVDKEILIKKEVRMNNGAKRCYYRFNLLDPRLQKDTDPRLQKDTDPRLQKDTDPRLQKDTDPRLQKDTDYNIYNDIIDNDNINGDNIGKGENEFSPSTSRTDKVKFSTEQGLTTENLHVKQSVIDKVDAVFSMLHFPVDDKEIKRLFFVLCCSVKWRNKTVNALQLNLNRVSKYEPSYIKKLIEDSIAGGWQGLVFSDTDRKYQDYIRMNKQSTQFGGTTFSVMSEEERNEALEYMNI